VGILEQILIQRLYRHLAAISVEVSKKRRANNYKDRRLLSLNAYESMYCQIYNIISNLFQLSKRNSSVGSHTVMAESGVAGVIDTMYVMLRLDGGTDQQNEENQASH
jgi:hypothetical protein